MISACVREAQSTVRAHSLSFLIAASTISRYRFNSYVPTTAEFFRMTLTSLCCARSNAVAYGRHRNYDTIPLMAVVTFEMLDPKVG